MDKKTQSALEYLLTYSWAFIIIVIVGAALFALGVFNPAGSTAIQVRGLSNFHIDDAKINSGGDLTVLLGIKTGKTTNVTDIDYSVQGLTCENTADDTDVIITPSQTKQISLSPGSTCSLTEGDTVIMDMNVTYKVGRSNLVHTDTGSVTLLVQS